MGARVNGDITRLGTSSDDTVAGMRVCIEVGQSQCPEPRVCGVCCFMGG